jgi:hypothetical protein
MERQGSDQPLARLTEEELNVLRECRNESFFYRCLPAMLIGNTLFHAAYKRGAIPQNRYALKQFGIAVLGFVAGKFSYIQTCKEKITRTLPPSSVLVQSMTGQKNLPDGTDQEANDSFMQTQQSTNNQQSSASQQTDSYVSYDDLRKKSRETQLQQQQYKRQDLSSPRESEKKMEASGLQTPPTKSGEKPKKFHVNQYGDIIYED